MSFSHDTLMDDLFSNCNRVSFAVVDRSERADSEVHQIADGQDENAEASQFTHPGVGQAETERGTG